MQEDQIDVGLAKLVARLGRFRGVIDQPEVNYVGPQRFKLPGDAVGIPIQPVFQPRKLRPVSIQSDAEESDARGCGRTLRCVRRVHRYWLLSYRPTFNTWKSYISP